MHQLPATPTCIETLETGYPEILLCCYKQVTVFLQVDASLSFLDDYVSEALERGATPYKPAHMRKAERPQEEREESKYPDRVDCGFEFQKIKEILGHWIMSKTKIGYVYIAMVGCLL